MFCWHQIDVPEERNVKEMLDKFMVQLSQRMEDQRVADPSLNDEENAPEMESANMDQLRKEYRIHDFRLFIYCRYKRETHKKEKNWLLEPSVVLGVVVTMFFLENFIRAWVHLPLPWIAVLGAMVLMVLADIENIEYLLHKVKNRQEDTHIHYYLYQVEWGTLMFFAALFVLLEGLEQLGLVDLIGNSIPCWYNISTLDDVATDIAAYIEKVPEKSRLTAAIIIIVWVSSIVSAIIDSIPYTTAMVIYSLRRAHRLIIFRFP